jgi:hypothetical protein
VAARPACWTTAEAAPRTLGCSVAAGVADGWAYSWEVESLVSEYVSLVAAAGAFFGVATYEVVS